MKTAIVNDENAMTFGEVAEEIGRLYHWASYEVRGRIGVIQFTAPDGRKFNLHTDGLAFEVKNEIEASLPDDDWEVDFRDDLDFTDLVWARDTEGCPMVIHN